MSLVDWVSVSQKYLPIIIMSISAGMLFIDAVECR